LKVESRIAFKTGFKIPGYFSKCFETYFGVLPSKFIADLKENQSPAGEIKIKPSD
jgi:transcriptional regulator GlxA family with amidase domain